jgi:hypothetical protein
MLTVMAEENLNWSTSPAVMTQTIRTAKEFLDAELAKYNTWEEIRSEDFFRTIGISNGQAFAKLKGTGVGRATLIKFLGKNWTDYKVESALSIIRDKAINQEAIKIISSQTPLFIGGRTRQNGRYALDEYHTNRQPFAKRRNWP